MSATVRETHLYDEQRGKESCSSRIETERTHSLTLLMEGRSGCPIELRGSDGHPYVRKHAKDSAYNSRLVAQASKQARFIEVNCASYRFIAPRVLASGCNSQGLNWFDMDYVRGSNYREFLLNAPVSDLQEFAVALLEFISRELANGTMIDPPRRQIQEKLRALGTDLATRGSSGLLAAAMVAQLEKAIPIEPLPVGECHGDLTLSNMIVASRNVYLLDFLDSFVETPVIDLAKLRQDTKFGWSVFIDPGIAPHQEMKLRQALEYLDRKIRKFIEDAGLLAWYEFFEQLNLARIVPYLSRETERLFIDECLRKAGVVSAECK